MSSMSPKPVPFHLQCLTTSRTEDVEVSPSSPQYYMYTFPRGINTVMIQVTSDSSTCMVVSIQDIKREDVWKTEAQWTICQVRVHVNMLSSVRTEGQPRRYQTDKLDRIQSDVSEVTSLLRDNVEKVVVRGDKIDDLQERSEELEAGSVNFRKSSTKLQKKMCWQNCKMNLIIAFVGIVIVIIIVVIIVVEVKPSSSSGHKNGTLIHNTAAPQLGERIIT